MRNDINKTINFSMQLIYNSKYTKYTIIGF